MRKFKLFLPDFGMLCNLSCVIVLPVLIRCTDQISVDPE